MDFNQIGDSILQLPVVNITVSYLAAFMPSVTANFFLDRDRDSNGVNVMYRFEYLCSHWAITSLVEPTAPSLTTITSIIAG